MPMAQNSQCHGSSELGFADPADPADHMEQGQHSQCCWEVATLPRDRERHSCDTEVPTNHSNNPPLGSQQRYFNITEFQTSGRMEKKSLPAFTLLSQAKAAPPRPSSGPARQHPPHSREIPQSPPGVHHPELQKGSSL